MEPLKGVLQKYVFCKNLFNHIAVQELLSITNFEFTCEKVHSGKYQGLKSTFLPKNERLYKYFSRCFNRIPKHLFCGIIVSGSCTRDLRTSFEYVFTF